MNIPDSEPGRKELVMMLSIQEAEEFSTRVGLVIKGRHPFSKLMETNSVEAESLLYLNLF